VIVKDKDNKIVLAVSLSDWNKDKQQYEEKYGEFPTRQIMLLPKTVMGYKSNHVTIKEATVVKDDEVVTIGKPIGEVVVKNSPKMMERQYRKVVVTPSNGYMLIAKGGAAPVKLPTQAKIAAEVKVLAEAKVAAETKVATEAKVATSARVATAARAKAEAESREGAEPKPAAPSKEQ